jgi:hypothetical protein
MVNKVAAQNQIPPDGGEDGGPAAHNPRPLVRTIVVGTLTTILLIFLAGFCVWVAAAAQFLSLQ